MLNMSAYGNLEKFNFANVVEECSMTSYMFYVSLCNLPVPNFKLNET